MNREPVVILGAVNAAVALVVGFGLDISAEQQGLIHAAASAALALFARAKVTPNESVATTWDDQRRGGYVP